MTPLRLGLSIALASLTCLTAHTAWGAPGDLDATFGTAGKVITSQAGVDLVTNSMAKQSDGKLLVVGLVGNADSFIHRYNTDGSLDTTWGTTGQVTTDFSPTKPDYLVGVFAQADGKLLVGGRLGVSATSTEAFIARYNANGTIDGTFGTAGKSVSTFGNAVFPTALVVRSDGRPVVVGYRDTGTVRSPFLYQTLADGTVDVPVGGGLTLAASVPTIVNQAAAQTDGKIVLSGYSGSTPTSDFKIYRVNADGSLDATFGTGGVATVDLGGYDAPTTVHVSPNGRIFAAGITVATGQSAGPIAMVCLEPSNGAPCTNFGTNGAVTVSAAPNVTNVVSILPQVSAPGAEADQFMLAGTIPATDGGDFFQVRLSGTGSLDTTFGKNGIAQNDMGGGADIATSAVSGSVIVGGRCHDGGTNKDNVCIGKFVTAGATADPFVVQFVQSNHVFQRREIGGVETVEIATYRASDLATPVAAPTEVTVTLRAINDTATAGVEYSFGTSAADPVQTAHIAAGATRSLVSLTVVGFDETHLVGRLPIPSGRDFELSMEAPVINASIGPRGRMKIGLADARGLPDVLPMGGPAEPGDGTTCGMQRSPPRGPGLAAAMLVLLVAIAFARRFASPRSPHER